MNNQDIKKIIELRTELIQQFQKIRDYKNNPNAIMKEVDHAKSVSDTIRKIDEILKEHVQFKTNE